MKKIFSFLTLLAVTSGKAANRPGMTINKYLILTTAVFISLFSNFGYSADYDFNPETQVNYRYQAPTIQGNIANFADEKVIVLYRGVHFLSDKFTREQRTQYIAANQVNEPMFSSAAYELANQNFGGNDHDLLRDHGQAVAALIHGLDDQDACTIKGRNYNSPRYAFQEIYSNNCKGFFNQLAEPAGDYEEIFNQFDFTKNPLLSFSDRVKHPGKYGFGLKNYGANQILSPEYDLQGRPKHPILGKLYGVILDEAAVEELKPLNVMRAHNRLELTLYNHFRNDILSEREISIAGLVPEDYVVFEMPLSVPSFTGPYPAYYQQKYGLTKQRYNSLRAIFTNAATTQATRNKKTEELMNGIIEARYQDNSLIYQNCISPSISALFERELGIINARISQLTLTYELE
ncbi:hypothetical protein [Candidatus Paracaedibacter symbiosus]|uniref:hypothetical protein n=1 Tax=Candidatus Paracaedibacter symbiosus TaxID=244582 RepID=UPI0005095768|nr:hypothetical protein [Candidatus Paracaedibacter symbiosus]